VAPRVLGRSATKIADKAQAGRLFCALPRVAPGTFRLAAKRQVKSTLYDMPNRSIIITGLFMILIVHCTARNAKYTQHAAVIEPAPTWSKRLITIPASPKFPIRNLGGRIARDSTHLLAETTFGLTYKNQRRLMSVHYKAKSGVSEEQLLSYFGLKTVDTKFPGNFGRGSIYDVIVTNPEQLQPFKVGSSEAFRIVQDWGSCNSRDITAYYLQFVENPYFSEVLIVVLNLLDNLEPSDLPLDNNRVATALQSGDLRYQIYPDLNDWLRTWVVIDSKN